MPDLLKTVPPVFFGLLAVVVVLVLLTAWLSARARAIRYERIDSVLTAAERAFLRPLEEATPRGIIVLMKVRLADFLRVPRGIAGRDYWRSFTRISSKHADFLLCDARSLRPRLVVELDDRSHERVDRRERDEFMDRACRSAGLPVVRVRWQRTYDLAELRARLEGQLDSQPKG